MRCIPALYHPTSIVLVDDDQDLLDSLSLVLSDQFKLHTFAFGKQSQTFLQTHCRHLHHKKAFYENSDESEINVQVNIHFQHFLQALKNPKRFEQIYIAILDHDMPDINGLALARQLKAILSIKIIM